MPFRSRPAAIATGVALAVTLAACGSGPGPGTAPESEGDLLAALPPPPTTTTTVVPSPTVAPPTTTKKPAPATSKKPAPPATGTRAAAPTDDGPDGQWKPASGDEFNGGTLDTGAWGPYHSVGAFGNGLRRPEAISQSDGVLRITAKGDVSGGMGHQFGQLYGRWEFRARTDPGRGFGSAILLWPDSENWPDDGEIDIMEVPSEGRDLAHFVLHNGPDNRLHGANVGGDFSAWHTFAVEWLPDRITWFVDGKRRYETTDPAMIPTKPMHLTIQLDQGPVSSWMPAPDATTPEEVRLQVDWVRIYAPA